MLGLLYALLRRTNDAGSAGGGSNNGSGLRPIKIKRLMEHARSASTSCLQGFITMAVKGITNGVLLLRCHVSPWGMVLIAQSFSPLHVFVRYFGSLFHCIKSDFY